MIRGRDLITMILLAATILFISSRRCAAQDDTPPPRMLLNLDLFTAPPPAANTAGAKQGSADSTLDQLRALRAMGYLGPDGPPPDLDDDSNPPPVNLIPKPQGGQQ